MRLILRNALTVGFVAALLAVIVDAAVGDHNIVALGNTAHGVAQAHKVQDVLEKFLSTVADAETGQRGFIITHDERYFAPYESAWKEAHVQIEAVRQLGRERPNLQPRLAVIDRLATQKLAELQDTIDLYRRQGPNAAVALIKTNLGKKYMDELRTAVAALETDEGQQLLDREKLAADNLRRARIMNLLGGGMGVGLVGLAFFLFLRDRRNREAAAANLQRANDQLEVRVSNRTTALQRTADELSIEVRDRRKAEEALRFAQEQLERRVAERTAELRQANARLADADRRKDEFLAMLAHELRNPLAPIRNAVSLLRKRPANDPVVDQMSVMLDRQVGHLAQLVDDLMDVARITSGKIELRVAATDLSAVVRRTMDAVAPLMAERRHRISADVSSEPVWVRGDPVRLEQILTNLLQNAAKYTPPCGQVRVTLTRLNSVAELGVADNGIGIRPEMLPRIFDMFQQGDRVGKLIEGLGIGLTLVRNLVELHGGTIEARSAGLGQGSEFIIRLPLTAPAPAAKPAPPRPDHRPRKVLVVDDNKDAAHSLAAVLRQEGHDVHVAYDGPAALAEAESAGPELVLLDIGMPGMDGYEVARRLRKTPQFDSKPIIALTGFGSAEDHRLSREAGFDQHLTKPVDPEALLDLLARV